MELIIDNFAGGGGASTGIEMAVGRSVDIAINHDPDAIAMHRANHPHTRHYCEDVWQVDPSEACAGNPVGLAWFSPDCTHFSRAKGGKPVDKNIRGLAWVTKPIKERAGETFDGFIKALTAGIPHDHPAFTEMCATLEISPDSPEAAGLEQGLGYNAEYRILRSCDYGAPTTRTRFYLIARCDGKPIVFPPPTHGNGKGLKPYHTAAECIDWSIPAQSIFERDKPLAENTLRRIARGIEKFVINNPEPFIVTVNHSGEGFRGQKADEPLGTVTAKNGYGVVAPTLIQYHSETASDEVRGQELNEPLMTVDTSPRYALSVAHIMKNYGGNYQGAGSGADKPLDTVTAHDHNSIITAHILTMRNNMDGQPADEPLATITAGGSHHAEVQAFLVKYFSNGTPKPVDSPLDTVTTKDRFALVTIHGEEYIITDIKMRMLQPRELFNAQGFPENYIIDHDDSGRPYPKSKQVTPPVPAELVRANLPEMCGGIK